MHPDDLECKADWDLTDLTGRPDKISRTSSRGENVRLREVCLVVHESVPSLVSDTLSLAKCGVKAVSRACIVQVRVAALKSAISFNITRFNNREWQIASKTSDFDTATAALELTKRRLRFAKDAVTLRWEQVHNQAAQLQEMEARQPDAKAALASAGFNLQFLSASKSAVQG